MEGDDETGTSGIPSDTIDFLYEHVRGQAARQVERGSQLDAKGLQLFSAACVVIGLGTLGATGEGCLITGALLMATVFFFVAACSVLKMLRIREWRVSTHADVLYREHWQDKPRDIKHAIIEDIADSVVGNHEILNEKAKFLKATHVMTSLEVIMVAVAALVSRVA